MSQPALLLFIMVNSYLGGQAVIEGIMMKSQSKYSVAVRDSNGKIITKTYDYKPLFGSLIKKIPFIRGIFNLIDSLYIGIKTLNVSSNIYYDDDDTSASNISTITTIIISFAFAIGLFVVIPFFVANIFRNFTSSNYVIAIIEGLSRAVIFILYIFLISRLKDIKRVFMYHGAEHKCINCIESLKPLTVENVRNSSKEHLRCGTSFIVFVIVISIVIGFFINVDNIALKLLIRVLLIPVIAGIAYELIYFSTKSNNKIIKLVSRLGLFFQKITTKEPDDNMIEVGIESINAIFDYKEFIANNE